MAQLDLNEGSFLIFRETNKSNDRAPDFTGEGLYNGERVRIAAWIKESKNNPGNKFLSGTIQSAREQGQTQSTDFFDGAPPQGSHKPDPNQDTPF